MSDVDLVRLSMFDGLASRLLSWVCPSVVSHQALRTEWLIAAGAGYVQFPLSDEDTKSRSRFALGCINWFSPG